MRKVSQNKFASRARTPLLSAIIFGAVILLVYTDSIITYDSVQHSSSSLEANNREIPGLGRIRASESQIKSSIPLLSMREEVDEVRNSSQASLIPPLNVTEEGRIKWFRKKLPKFEILKSSNLTQEFHGRVFGFFNNECEVQFFMIWISPATAFGRREFLAVESLFKAHPRGCLVILSRTLDSTKGYRILKPLIDNKFMVAAATPDLSFLFKNTPAEGWFEELKTGKKDPGDIPLPQNLSNLIRLSVLYKFGGVYLDADFIVLKSFTGLKNSIGAQSIDTASKNWTRLNNAVLIFDRGHPLLFQFIREFASTFDGNKWGHNGPYLVSRVVRRVAGRPGYDFTVLPPMAFYPVYWTRIGGLFKKPADRAGSRWVQAKLLQLSGETYGVHLWNRQSSAFRIEEGSVMHSFLLGRCVICEHSYSF